MSEIAIYTLVCGASEEFVKAQKAFDKTFWGTASKCKNKNLS